MKSRFVVGAVFVGLAILSGSKLFGEPAALQEVPDGVGFDVSGESVELRVAWPSAFRLHVSSSPGAVRSPSIYLSRTTHLPTSPMILIQTDAGTVVGIHTGFGELLVNGAKKTWTLRDASGATLTDWAPLGGPSSTKQGMFDLAVGASPVQSHPLYYGSGNIPHLGALTQSEGHAKTDNGSAALPQYWSTAGYGALLIGSNDNAPGSWRADATGGVDWSVPGTSADLYLCPAPDLYAWLRADAELTGFAPVPPRWTFGYMQSRWGWKDKAYIDDTLARFRADHLPVDAFILDFEWYTVKPDYQVKAKGEPGFVDFDWNPKLFPDPRAQLADYAKAGLHVVGIRKPRIGRTDLIEMAHAKNWILPPNPLDPNGAQIRTRNLDFSVPDVRTWWAENNRVFLEDGLAGFWNDEGESDYIEYSYWNTAEVKLLQQVRPGARFWSLNRSFIPGMQRFGAAVWTGDIASDWATLAKTPGELLSYGLSGMPYSTCDIGGFSGVPDAELLTRWMQAGVFFPVMRSHSSISVPPHFPWLYGPEAEGAMRQALDLRYRLIPYYDSLAHETNATGAPLMRPLVMEFAGDPQAVAITDEWLMGKGLLAAPILTQGGARNVYLPNGGWYKFGSSQRAQGPQTVPITARLDDIPLYVRAGTLLPLGPVRQSTGEVTKSPLPPLELQIYPGRDASFDFVEDDGETLAYQAGAVRHTLFSWSDQTRILSWNVTGNYSGPQVFRGVRAVLFSSRAPVSQVAVLGSEGSISFR